MLKCDGNVTGALAMSAVAKVLNTYELLENILMLCHHKDILNARKVDKRWRKIVLESLAVRKARVLIPLRPEDFEHVPSQEQTIPIPATQILGQPHYPLDDHYAFRVNPSLSPWTIRNSFQPYSGPIIFDNVALHASRISMPGPHYISSPPVSVVRVSFGNKSDILYGHWEPPSNFSCCLLRVSSGITIQDLMDTYQRMSDSFHKFQPSSLPRKEKQICIVSMVVEVKKDLITLEKCVEG
ncbi:hypothetical protein LTR37_021181 [Vermiconidia calcicola]|uniref:Uncharacterized protein n=1 Tax=Vermiconidia calcicola TaxID=1690605 RepID=A0ACC3MB51_9PEZI|nr:hypothetical protein LTR37_021181 [Vermiconidia calcicola]